MSEVKFCIDTNQGTKTRKFNTESDGQPVKD